MTFGGRTFTIATFPSWFFGGGAEYLTSGLTFLNVAMIPIDPVLTTASAAREGGRIVPFVTLGAGVMSRIGGTPQATLRGEYVTGGSIAPPPGFPLAEVAQSDTITIRYSAGARLHDLHRPRRSESSEREGERGLAFLNRVQRVQRVLKLF